MAQRFLKIAVVFLFLGAVLGITMGILQNFALVPVHAHVVLLVLLGLGLFMVNVLINVRTAV